jgi:hypothetical protein
VKEKINSGSVCNNELIVHEAYCVYLQLANIEFSDMSSTANNTYWKYGYCKRMVHQGHPHFSRLPNLKVMIASL